MKKHRRVLRIFLGSLTAALLASVALASAASASPAWAFNGTTLTGSETVVGNATASTLALTGLTTTCDISYSMTISNSVGGTAEGKVTSATLNKCSTDGVCTVSSTKAENLPWPVVGKTVGKGNYVVVSGIAMKVFYGNEECAVSSLLYKGSAGGLFDNPSSTFTFSPANSEATGTQLTTFGSTPVKWNGTFSTEATGSHKGQALTLS
jgi:hypothetical protein